MSLVDQHMQLQNLMPLLRCTSIKVFMRGTILFRWPWRCIIHLGTICIVSSRSVHVFSTINDQEVICPCLFAFNLLGNMLLLFFNMFQSLLQKGRLCWRVMFVLDRRSLLNLMICMQATLEEPWVKQLTSMKGTSFLPFFGSCGLFVFSPFFGLHFLFPL